MQSFHQHEDASLALWALFITNYDFFSIIANRILFPFSENKPNDHRESDYFKSFLKNNKIKIVSSFYVKSNISPLFFLDFR